MATTYTGRSFRGPFKWILQAFSAAHIAAYRLTGGIVGGWLTPTIPILLLTTKGRRSGQHRVVPLIYLVDDDAVVVVASLGGAATPPAWWRNLRDYPFARVRIGRRRWTARATEATGAERARLWEKLVALYPPYASYARATTRPIPVVVLRPRDAA